MKLNIEEQSNDDLNSVLSSQMDDIELSTNNKSMSNVLNGCDFETNKESIICDTKEFEINKNENKESEINEININVLDNNNNKQYKNSMPFGDLVDILLKIEKDIGVNSKNYVKDILSEFFVKIIDNYPQDLVKIYYFFNYKIGPSYLIPEMYIAEEKLEKMLEKIFCLFENSLKYKLGEIGDLGQVAANTKKEQFKKGIKGNPGGKITLSEIMNELEEASLDETTTTSKNNISKKYQVIYYLLSKQDGEEMKFFIRFIQKNLKLGISFNLLLSAISSAIAKVLRNTDEKSIYDVILRSFNQMQDEDILFGQIIEIIQKKSDFNDLIHSCHIRVGVPVNYQLSESTVGKKTLMKEIDNNRFTLEYKYKGIRCQVHCNKNKIQIFNKSLEDITQKYPELVGYTTIFINKSIEKNKKEIKSFILDCTMLAYDKKNDMPILTSDLSFFPKEKVNEKVKNQICIFCFDLILLNGDVLINKSFKERRKTLYNTFSETMSFRFVKHKDVDNLKDKDEIDEFMNEALLSQTNGLICKLLKKNANYLPGLKSQSWIKINRSYYKADLDSLYFAIIGAKYGIGERKMLFSSVVLATLNEDDDSFESIAMTHGTLKGRHLDEMLFHLKDYIIKYIPSNYKFANFLPDVIFSPKIVVQAKTFLLCLNQDSAVGYNVIRRNYGISLRFPRILKLREDKKIRQICTSQKIIDLYKSQDFTQTIDYENVKEGSIEKDN